MTDTGLPITIAIDAMGGDFAPQAVVEGVWRAVQEDGAHVILVGDQARIEEQLERVGGGLPADRHLAVEHAPEVIAMEEPAIAVAKKRQSSIRVCARLVREGRAHAMVTAGHTGAALIAAKTVIGAIPGVDRPALAGVFPTRQGRTVMLDVGANIGAKVTHFRQFAVMGHFYAQEVLGTAAPRVGLMSVGEEEGKGTDTTREVFRALRQTGLNFVGNVEGRDLFRGTVDVIVCDGFVGNVVLKSSESLVGFVGSLLRREMARTPRTRLGASLAAPAFDRFQQLVDWSEYGAAPLLGVRGGCFVGHGRSGDKAIKNAIRRAGEFCAANLHQKIEEKVAELHEQEDRLRAENAPGASLASTPNRDQRK